jgi:nucleoside phosphorylase
MRDFLSGEDEIMALQNQPQLYRQRGYPVWAQLLLLLLPTVLEIFNVANMIPRSWITTLNTLLTAMNAILVFRPRVSTEVLLVSVTDIEVQAVLTVFPNAIKTVIQNRTYYSLGRVGQTRTYMVQATGMGPVGVRTCIEDGIRALSPKAIILVGIAFGLKGDRQQISDVLVSRQIQDYDPQRYGTGSDQQPLIHLRGNRVTATEWLLDRFSSGKHDWHGPATIHIGLLLSGSLLIDHYETRERLLHLMPEALGGEMEGATLCDVALRNHVGWIVVKAIADWADGNKRQDEQEQQKHAAEHAAQFVYHVLQQADFIQEKE